jgi:GNAT superfamily N-acetyltransferase
METNRLRHPYREAAAWEIRPAKLADITELKQMFCRLHLHNASLDPRFALAEGWERYVDDLVWGPATTLPHLALVARQGGRPAGFVLAVVHRDAPLWRYRVWVEVEALYVERPWRGSGLADAMLGQALAWAADRGLPVVQLYVTASNARALRFYERHGFRPAQVILRAVLSDEAASSAQPATA